MPRSVATAGHVVLTAFSSQSVEIRSDSPRKTSLVWRSFRSPSRSSLGFGSPQKFSLQSFWVYALPVEFGFVCPVLVDPRINVVSERRVQIVIASSLLEIHVKFQFSDAFFQPNLMLVRLALLCHQLVHTLFLYDKV